MTPIERDIWEQMRAETDAAGGGEAVKPDPGPKVLFEDEAAFFLRVKNHPDQASDEEKAYVEKLMKTNRSLRMLMEDWDSKEKPPPMRGTAS